MIPFPLADRFTLSPFIFPPLCVEHLNVLVPILAFFCRRENERSTYGLALQQQMSVIVRVLSVIIHFSNLIIKLLFLHCLTFRNLKLKTIHND